MGTSNPFQDQALASQLRLQRKYAWDLDRDFPWADGIDLSKPFVPLNQKAIAFPGASAEQRLALSQLMGLIVNSTIAETEEIIQKLRTTAWENVLKSYPVNPEMWDLGELFFEEEIKHSLAFSRYNEIFCRQTGIEPEDLKKLLPNGFNSRFLKKIISNAQDDGHSFWWVVAFVEEVSIEIYKDLHPVRAKLDPLYFTVHRRHLEEEARHANYAFLMLNIIQNRRKNWKRYWHQKWDLLRAQVHSNMWVISELCKINQVGQFENKHPFFKVIKECLPLMNKIGYWNILRDMYVRTPYLNLILNSKNHLLTSKMADAHSAISLPLPEPQSDPMGVEW